MIKHKKEYNYNYNEWTGIKRVLQNGNYKKWFNGNSRTEYCSAQIKHSLDKINSRLKREKKRTSELEDKWIRLIQSEKKRKEKDKNYEQIVTYEYFQRSENTRNVTGSFSGWKENMILLGFLNCQEEIKNTAMVKR